MIDLIRVYIRDDNLPLINRIEAVMSKLKKELCFSGSRTRLLLSKLAFLITVDEEDAGFIYFVNEDDKTKEILFLDLAVLSEYRNQKVASACLKKILNDDNLIKNRFVLAEVSPDNEASLGLMKSLGTIQVSHKHFLLQPNRLEEFNNHIRINKVNIEEELLDYYETLYECIAIEEITTKNPEIEKSKTYKKEI